MSCQAKAIQIVTYEERTGKGHWEMTAEGIAFLQAISNQLCVVGIAGAMRGGKSYIMNLLINQGGESRGVQPRVFELGSTVRSKTRGVWAFATPLKSDPSKTLLLLDFEGMFDTSDRRENPNFDPQIFLLAVLCSSYFIYNTLGTINSQALGLLGFVAEVGDHMHLELPAVEGGGGGEDLGEDGHDSQFPDHFTWLVRDFCLELEESMTDNDYLEDALKEKAGTQKVVRATNSIRTAIKENFQSRSCFTLPRPVDQEEQLQKVDELPYSALRPQFVEKVTTLIRHVLERVRPKRIRDHRGISSKLGATGDIFSVFLQALLTQLNTSGYFVITDAWTNVATAVTKKAFDVAVKSYADILQESFSDASLLPYENDFFLTLNNSAFETVTSAYIQAAILREDPVLGLEALKTKLAEIEADYQERNIQQSTLKVEAKLEEFLQGLRSKFDSRAFPELKDYEKEKQTIVQRARGLKGTLGPAWDRLESGLLKSFVDMDKLSVMAFNLTDLEKEVQQKNTSMNTLTIEKKQLQERMEQETLNNKIKEERWNAAYEEMKRTHAAEMVENQREMDEKLRVLHQQHQDAIARHDLALAEQKVDSQRKLTDAITQINSEHQKEMRQIDERHHAQQLAFEQTKQQLQSEIQSIRAQSEQERSNHEAEMAKMNQQLQKEKDQKPSSSGYQILFWPWFI